MRTVLNFLSQQSRFFSMFFKNNSRNFWNASSFNHNASLSWFRNGEIRTFILKEQRHISLLDIICFASIPDFDAHFFCFSCISTFLCALLHAFLSHNPVIQLNRSWVVCWTQWNKKIIKLLTEKTFRRQETIKKSAHISEVYNINNHSCMVTRSLPER